MGMLKKDPPQKKLLTRGAKIEVDNTVNRLEFLERITPQEQEVKPIVPATPYNTKRVSIKVDNHTRNKLYALTTLGIGDSIGMIVQELTNQRIEKLTKSEYERYRFLFETYEAADLAKNKK